MQTSAFCYLFDSWVVHQSGCIYQHMLYTVLSRSTSCKFVLRSIWNCFRKSRIRNRRVVSRRAFKVISLSVPVCFESGSDTTRFLSDSLIFRRCCIYLPIKSTVCSFVSQLELSAVPVRQQHSHPSSRFQSVVGSGQAQVPVNYKVPSPSSISVTVTAPILEYLNLLCCGM